MTFYIRALEILFLAYLLAYLKVLFVGYGKAKSVKTIRRRLTMHGLYVVFVDRMPYMVATIHEVMRCKPLLPFAVHATLHDTEVGGYFVPSGTMVQYIAV